MPVAPVYADDPRLAALIGPGAPFEVEDVVIDGVELRDFVRTPATIVDLFRMGVAHDDLVHAVYGEERMTFREMRAKATALAKVLRDDFGVGVGDRIAIAMRNLPEFVVAFWGGALNGAIVAPLNSLWTGEELNYALEDCGAKVGFVDADRLQRSHDEGGPPAGTALVAVRTTDHSLVFDELVAGEQLPEDEFAQLTRDDLITILYTSGTTGRPKGAPASNRAHITSIFNMAFANAREAILAQRAPKPPRQPATLSAQPLFHIGGVASIISGPMGGTKLVMMHKWNLEEAVRLAQEEGITNLGGVPTIARQFLDHPGIGELGLDIRGFPMGGAAVPPDLPIKAVQVFGEDIQLLNGYGLTETTSACATNIGVEFEAHPDSVGRANLTADIRIVDLDGTELGVGEKGEICFRSPQNTKGYWNNPEATAEVFRDGWFHSGDVGYFDAEGFLYVSDRLKDVVIRGGENIYCPEVEGVIFTHPAVAEVVVFGLPEPVMGERLCAAVVVREGESLDLDELRAHVGAHLAGFKCPEALYLTDELPKTATSKYAKRELRAALTADDSAVTKRY
ncbi:MAG: class I adenylate-forming enzyme family protein [Acidimicrobiia bacterium]